MDFKPDYVRRNHFLPSSASLYARVPCRAIISACIIFLVSAAETIGDTSALVSGGLNRESRERKYPAPWPATLRIRPFHCIRMSACNLILPECGPGGHDKGGQPFHNHDRGGLHDFSRTPSACGKLFCLPASGRAWRMHHHDVRHHSSSGVQMIAKCGFSQRNIVIVSLSLAVGIGFTTASEIGIWDIFP